MLFCLKISCNMNYQNKNLIYQYINLTPFSISYYGLISAKKKITCFVVSGFPTGVENMGGTVPPHGGGEGLNQCMGGLKMLLKNTCEGVYLILKLPAKSLQACKFTKNELHTYFSRILARF